jgi:hypothetical protein
MSWVDLGVVALILWGAAKGYLAGIHQMFLRVMGFCAALLCAVVLQRPFAAYLNQDWQAEAIFVRLAARNVEEVIKAGGSGSNSGTFSLPALAGPVMRWLSGEPAMLEVMGNEAGMAALGRMLLSFAAAGAFFAGSAAAITLLLRIHDYRAGVKPLPEWKKIAGMLAGIVGGAALSVIICVLLDGFSMLATGGMLAEDISGSVLYRTIFSLLNR